MGSPPLCRERGRRADRSDRHTTADGRTLVVRPAVGADARAVRALIDAVAAEPDVPLLATPGSIGLRDVRT